MKPDNATCFKSARNWTLAEIQVFSHIHHFDDMERISMQIAALLELHLDRISKTPVPLPPKPIAKPKEYYEPFKFPEETT